MRVLIDTSVWSEVLRRGTSTSKFTHIVQGLIQDGLVSIMGPIRQELLSGIPNKKQFNNLKEELSYFPDIPIQSTDYVKAADYDNQCRTRGIQGSHVDFLICAVAHSHNLEILTTDNDFGLFSKVLPIKVVTPKS